MKYSLTELLSFLACLSSVVAAIFVIVLRISLLN
nr:MAG TPA: hypothetical protein [Bacteriophage sp.]